MSLLADMLATLIDQRRRFGGVGADGRPIEEMARDLLGSRGEVSGITLACDILDRYEGFDDAEKLAFFRFLVAEMDIDRDAARGRNWCGGSTRCLAGRRGWWRCGPIFFA